MIEHDISWFWVWPSLDAELAVHQRVANFLQEQKQRWWEKERGGLLFADIYNAVGPTLMSATPPHATDRAGPWWLELNQDRCRLEIEAANTRGERLVGYWHTHPQNIPSISHQDIKTFREFSLKNRTILPHPLAIIVGNGPTARSVRAWSIRPDRALLAGRLVAQRPTDDP